MIWEEIGVLDERKLKLKYSTEESEKVGSLYQVHVQTQTGLIFTLEVASDYTIAKLKDKVQNEAGIPVDQQCIIYAGKQLEDGRTLSDCKSHQQSSLILVAKLSESQY